MFIKSPPRWLTVLCFILPGLCGCDQSADDSIPEARPRPVEVRTLVTGTPPTSSFVSAPVASWKTEEIGMEVGGRIEWVAEPNTSIEGRVVDKDGNVIVEGTPIARIDKERYELQMKSADAQVARATSSIASANIELTRSLPAQIAAAEAEKKRSLIELNRSKRLLEKSAGAKSNVDRDEAAYSSADSKVEQLKANLKGKEADLQSLEAQLLQADDSLREAERSLEDCTLYSSFRGQIASVSVVPGSVLSTGQPVATIQMMDPIKVEVEVSAEDSRRLRNRQRLAVQVTREDGTIEEQDGYLYLVDPTADPLTRTFTLTLLMMNRRITDDEDTSNLATIDQTWRVDFQFLPGAEDGKLYLSHDAILNDETGPFIWRLDDMHVGGQIPQDRRLKVSKLRVKLGPTKLPFLGNWIFQEIIVDDESFDSKTTLIAGKLVAPDGKPDAWNGDSVLVQNEGQWMLRPGDLVKVNLAENDIQAGIYVPMNAIAYEAEKTFLFLLSEGSESTVERIEVVIDDDGTRGTSAVRAVSAADKSVELSGRRYVSQGAHYLRDGERVRVVEAGLSE